MHLKIIATDAFFLAPRFILERDGLVLTIASFRGPSFEPPGERFGFYIYSRQSNASRPRPGTSNGAQYASSEPFFSRGSHLDPLSFSRTHLDALGPTWMQSESRGLSWMLLDTSYAVGRWQLCDASSRPVVCRIRTAE